MAKSPEQMAASMVANMKEKTGKSLEQWVKLASKPKLEKHGQIVKHLKTEHGLTHGYANLVAHHVLGSAAATGGTGGGPAAAADLVAAQYAGPKADLKPIYDAVIAAVAKFGKDVEISPKKAYVSLRRKTQFAIVQPTTKSRVDVGIKLKGVEPQGRLEAAGSFNAMVTHRVRVEYKQGIDAELKRWLKTAYDKA